MTKTQNPSHAIRLLLTGFFAAISLFLLHTTTTHAATFTVAAGNDENTDNASCSLTEAIENINDQATTNTDCSPTGAYGTDDTINLPAGTVTLVADLPELTTSIVVRGQGVDATTIDGVASWEGLATAAGNGAGISMSVEALTFDNNATLGMSICAENIAVSHVKVINAGTGAALGGFSGDCLTHAISVEDSSFNENGINEGENNGGLYIAAFSDGTYDIQIDIARVRANNNGVVEATNGSLISGMQLYIDCANGEDCLGSQANVSVVDTQTNGNSSVLSAGLKIQGNYSSTLAINVIMDRVTSSNNTVEGVLVGGESGAPFSGVFIQPVYQIDASNVTVSGNYSNALDGSDVALTGFMSFSLGGTDSNFTNLSNATIVGNHLDSETDLTLLALAGFGTAVTPDFSTIIPGEIRNTIIADNSINGNSAACALEGNFGGGPVDITPVSLGGNLTDSGTCSSFFTHPSDQNNVSALADTFGSLGDYGGYVPTIPLLEASPAIDAGITIPTLTTDARGVSRPLGLAYDSGAYESPFTRTVESTESLAGTGASIGAYTALALLSVLVAVGFGLGYKGSRV